MTERRATGAPRLEILQAEDRHAAEIAEFIRVVWDPSATPESVLTARAQGAASNVAEPGVPPPTWIALQGGKTLGYVTTIPIRLWDGQRDWSAYWIKGLMVLPEFRGGPIGYHLVKGAVARLPRSGALAVAQPARRLFEAVGYRDLGAVPNFIRPIAPHRILDRLDPAGLGLSGLPRGAESTLRFARWSRLGAAGGWAAGWALRATAGATRLAASSLSSGPFDPSTSAAELDALWLLARANYPSVVVHDSKYLIQRYPSGPDTPYEWQAVREGGTLAGVTILRRPRADGDPRLRGIRVATLADALYPPDRPNAGLALLGAVERSARNSGADAILTTSSAPPLRSLLRRQCYLPLSANVHFLFRDVSGEATALGPTLPEWWIMRGDGQADEVF